MTARLTRRGFAAAALALVAAGRAGAQADAISGTVHEVEIRDLTFLPGRIEARAGDGIRWTNADIAPHTATAADDSWDTGKLGRGDSAVIAVTQGMTGPYRCRFHPHMTGEIVVLPG